MTSGALSAWWHWAALFAAGGCGACLRYALARWVDGSTTAPLAGTLVVNLIGCFAIGVLSALLAPGPGRTIALAGLLGGFTTYSTFALLTVDLAQASRWGAAGWQLAAHVAGGAALVLVGAWVGGLLGGRA